MKKVILLMIIMLTFVSCNNRVESGATLNVLVSLIGKEYQEVVAESAVLCARVSYVTNDSDSSKAKSSKECVSGVVEGRIFRGVGNLNLSHKKGEVVRITGVSEARLRVVYDDLSTDLVYSDVFAGIIDYAGILEQDTIKIKTELEYNEALSKVNSRNAALEQYLRCYEKLNKTMYRDQASETCMNLIY